MHTAWEARPQRRAPIPKKEHPMAKIDFGGVKEEVVTRDEFTLEKARQVLKNETIAVIGYGVQGPAQALNMRDNGFPVIIGSAPEFKREWDKAVKDGWVPGKTLFPIEEAARKATVDPVPGVRRGAEGGVAEAEALPEGGRRPCTSPTGSPSSTRTRPAWCRRRTSTSSSWLPRARARACARTSSRRAASTPATPCSRTHGQREGAHPRPRHRHRLGVPVPDHLRAGGLQRPHRASAAC